MKLNRSIYNLRNYSQCYEYTHITNEKKKKIKQIKKVLNEYNKYQKLGYRRSTRIKNNLRNKIKTINSYLVNYQEYYKKQIINKTNKRLSKNSSVNIYNKKNLQYFKKGSKSLYNGIKYEQQIYSILKNTYLNGQKFNTQTINELAGSKPINDITCNFVKNKNIGIEVKICSTPDWMQCSLKKDDNKNWEGSENGKIPYKSKLIFDNLIRGKKIFNNKIPPFLNKKLTYNEWKIIKKKDNSFNDQYFKIPNDIIKNIYREKNCYYIQISNYGLYHLGNDICNFGVPEFSLPQRLRIRNKVHSSKDVNKYCNLSVMASCQPINIKLLKKSNYSLDKIELLPINLKYINR